MPRTSNRQPYIVGDLLGTMIVKKLEEIPEPLDEEKWYTLSVQFRVKKNNLLAHDIQLVPVEEKG